jgi:hypothetical protein
MIETPDEHTGRSAGPRYPADPLTGFRWHTGATPRPLEADEPCPVLFRDVGLDGMLLFLAGRMRRWAGPLSPLVYARTEHHIEPYTDHGRVGRLVFLRPLDLHPWHAGTPHVFIAHAGRAVDSSTVAFVPGNLPLADAAHLARDLPDALAWREALGGRLFDEQRTSEAGRLAILAAELEATEVLAEPVRRALQGGGRGRDAVRSALERAGLTETDLCSAWHHLPASRRAVLREALPAVRAACEREAQAGGLA